MSFARSAVFTYERALSITHMEQATMNSLNGKTALVVGASRGLGRGIV